MEQAEIELGFDARIPALREAVSDTDHGFIITITRIEEEAEFESYRVHKERNREGSVPQEEEPEDLFNPADLRCGRL